MVSWKYKFQEARKPRFNGGKTMKINLQPTYLNEELQMEDIQRQLIPLEEKLKTPSRTIDDIIRHIELIKERNRILYGNNG